MPIVFYPIFEIHLFTMYNHSILGLKIIAEPLKVGGLYH